MFDYFLIEKAGRQDFSVMITWPSINQDVKADEYLRNRLCVSTKDFFKQLKLKRKYLTICRQYYHKRNVKLTGHTFNLGLWVAQAIDEKDAPQAKKKLYIMLKTKKSAIIAHLIYV